MARVNQALIVSTILLASVQHASGAYACSPNGGKKLKTPDGNCSAGVCDDASCCTDHVCDGMNYDSSTEYLDLTATVASDCKKTMTDCVSGDCTGTMTMLTGSKCQGACTESDCCTRVCTTGDCPGTRELLTGSPTCSSATTPCPKQECCKPLCSDYTCLAAYNEKKSPAGTCAGQACLESDCCEHKAGSCSANTVTCPDGKSKLLTNTNSGDAVASCCVADTKCSGGGTISRALGTDIASSALLFLIAMAVA